MSSEAALDLRDPPATVGVVADAAAESGFASVELDLHPALSVLGFFDGVYIVVANLPAGARLSAGRCNSDFTWSLLPDELGGLRLVLPAVATQDCALTVSIVTPDPLGYEYASTSAQFNVFISGGVSSIPFGSLRRVDAAPLGGWSGMIQRARAVHAVHEPEAAPVPRGAEADDRRLSAALAEWRADEDIRLARARARWEEEAEAEWARRATGLVASFERAQQDRDSRWKEREAGIIAANDAQWGARLAASEIRMRADETSRIAAAVVQLQEKGRNERWRLAAGWLLFTVTIGSMVLA